MSSRIVIVGASASGLACAVALHQAGFSNVTLLEKAQSPGELEHEAPINLGANVVRAFGHLGLKDRLLTHSWRWAGARVVNLKGHTLASMDGDHVLARSGFSPITTTRRQMLSVLRSAVPEAWLTYGTEVTSVSEGSSFILVHTDDKQTREADLVIGADGFYSVLRKQVLGETKIRTDGKVSVQALIPAIDAAGKLKFSADNMFTEIISPRGSVGFGRNNDDDFNVFFNVPEREVKDAMDAPSLLRYVKDTYSGIDERIDAICRVVDPDRIRVYFPKDRELARTWSKGRIVLIGDAAHPCFQYTGQGAAMAIESALVLAHSLKLERTLSGALCHFEKLRMPRVKVVHGESYKIGQAFGIRNPLVCVIRDVVMRLIPDAVKSRPLYKIHVEEFLP